MLNHSENLSFKELKQTNFIVSVVVPIDFNLLLAGDIEEINDKASAIVTGSEVALNDINYEVYNHFYNKDNYS